MHDSDAGDITCLTLPHKINPLDGTAMDVMTREVITRRWIRGD